MTESEASLKEAFGEVRTREEARLRLRIEQIDSLDGTARVLADVEQERDDQNRKWGGTAHDDQHGPRDWGAFITEHLGKALSERDTNLGSSYRRRMVQVAALAVAAIETHDRKEATQ